VKEKLWQEAFKARFKVIYRHMPEGVGGNHNIPEVGIALAWAEI
jgi:hypothetical protein